ncbi:MAG TPA: hypothetical protein VL306_03015, partial [Methylomirabilota bacterium]|nr:hypothetical protein [Methylomirabilota bacterium]
NQNKNADATIQPANPSDVITFTLNAENHNDQTIPGYMIQVDISDIANTATLLDASGASFNGGNNSLVWTPEDIGANQSVEKQFVVKVNEVTGSDSMLKIKFNNELNIAVAKTAGASTEIATPSTPQSPVSTKPFEAPKTGTKTDVVLWLSLAVVAGFLARKLLKLN